MYIFFFTFAVVNRKNENTRLTSFADTCVLVLSLSKPL